MNKNEFSKAFKIAEERSKIGAEFDHTALDLFLGCGLPEFKQVCCTIEAVSDLIRWQAKCLDGSWDHKELNSLADIARRKFLIIN